MSRPRSISPSRSIPQRLPRRWLALWLAAAMVLPGCSAIDVLNASIPTHDFVKTADIAYGPDAREKLDVYTPKAPPAPGQHYPVVVFFYGGSWQNGSRADYLFVAQALVSKGYIAVVPDYRVYPEVVFPAFMQDAASAVKWARDHAAQFGGDPHRVFLMGHSAGAHIAVMLGSDGRYLQAAGMGKNDISGIVGLAGPYDFLPLVDPVIKKIFPPPLRAASQPINWVDGHEPPMWLAAGTFDHTVQPSNTTRMAQRLSEAGDAVQTRYYRGLGHAPLVAVLAAPLRGTQPVLDDLARFIDARCAQQTAASAPAALQVNGR
jgi:acetyl esterase/lipase